MKTKIDLSGFDFAPVIQYDGEWTVFDLSREYNPEFLEKRIWGIGRYNEKRPQMYKAPQYEGRRNIHMGIDLWTPPGEPVFAFYDGTVAYKADHDQPGNYGPTIITKHSLNDRDLYALHGHLSRASLGRVDLGQDLKKGEKFAETGTKEENGEWVPHLHFQISFNDPGKPDMPGVVAEEERKEALKKYPDPRLVLGNLY